MEQRTQVGGCELLTYQYRWPALSTLPKGLLRESIMSLIFQALSRCCCRSVRARRRGGGCRGGEADRRTGMETNQWTSSAVLYRPLDTTADTSFCSRAGQTADSVRLSDIEGPSCRVVLCRVVSLYTLGSVDPSTEQPAAHHSTDPPSLITIPFFFPILLLIPLSVSFLFSPYHDISQCFDFFKGF